MEGYLFLKETAREMDNPFGPRGRAPSLRRDHQISRRRLNIPAIMPDLKDLKGFDALWQNDEQAPTSHIIILTRVKHTFKNKTSLRGALIKKPAAEAVHA